MARALRLKDHQLINLPGGTRLEWAGEAVREEVEAKLFEKMGEYAEKIAASARSNAPEDDGDLRKSIAVVIIKSGNKFFFTDKRHWGIVARARHAMFVELGTKKTPKQPYMWPAYEEHKDEIMRAAKDIIGK